MDKWYFWEAPHSPLGNLQENLHWGTGRVHMNWSGHSHQSPAYLSKNLCWDLSLGINMHACRIRQLCHQGTFCPRTTDCKTERSSGLQEGRKTSQKYSLLSSLYKHNSKHGNPDSVGNVFNHAWWFRFYKWSISRAMQMTTTAYPPEEEKKCTEVWSTGSLLEDKKVRTYCSLRYPFLSIDFFLISKPTLEKLLHCLWTEVW